MKGSQCLEVVKANPPDRVVEAEDLSRFSFGQRTIGKQRRAHLVLISDVKTRCPNLSD